MKKPKSPKVQYGRSFRYRSNEAAIKDLVKLEKKQQAEKAKKAALDKSDERVTRGEESE